MLLWIELKKHFDTLKIRRTSLLGIIWKNFVKNHQILETIELSDQK